MKTKEMIQRLSLFLLALVLTMPAWAQGSSGNESETITIASKEDWKTFCDRVNKGQTTLNAKLTRDVNLETDIVMVGNIINMYSGTFDGQGHTLKFNWNAGKDDGIAPFRYVENATIKNLRTQGKITTTGWLLSGMVLEVYGATTISNCVSDMDITGGSGWTPSNAAGMIRSVQTGASVTLTDCVVKGSLTDQANEGNRAMAGIVFTNMASCTQIRCLYLGTNNADNNGRSSTFVYNGDANTTLTDCYYLKPCGKVQGEKVTAERLKSGEMAKLLQGDRPEQVWGQTLGTDNEPLPTTDATKRVYEVKFNYNGNTASRYATSGSAIFGGLPTAKELLGTAYDTGKTYTMTFDGGNFTATTPVTADKTVAVQITVQKNDFTIASADDWQTFCQRVNGGEPGLNAKLMQDVDLGEDIWMVGERNSYLGTFDGQGHTLTLNWDAGYKSNIAPFQYVDGATIKNLRTQGKITSRDGQYLSGLVFEAYGATTLTGCVSDVDITGGRGVVASGAAGMVQKVSDGASVQITDCLVKGSITDNAYADLRAMAGFVYDNSGTCTLTRCLYLGKNNAPANKNSSTFANGNATLTDCYYLYRCGQAQEKYVGESRLKSGEMAYLLQGGRTDNVWGQTLGTDNAPQLTAFATEAAKVYKVDFTYNGNTGSRYANGGQPIYGGLPTLQDILGKNYNAHHYYTQLSFGDFTAATTISGDRTVSVTFTETDCVTIASKADWQTFREIVNSGQNGVDAKLTANVDLGTDIAMMGNGRSYRGIFDGQGHTLSFNWDAGSKENIAPFQFVEGATIRNLNVAGAIKSSGRTLSGLVGNALGTTTISNCVSDVNITSGHKTGACEVAGMIAYVNDYAEVDITDCVVKGTLNATENEGKKGMAGFVYLQTGYCTLTNCLYAGTNNATAGSYTFGSNTIRKNCYYLNPCGKAQGERIVEKQLESGEVAYKLQGDRTDSCHWAQVLGEKTPSLYREADRTKPNYVYYNKENNGWTCDDFRLTDGQSLPIGLDFTATKATYDRTLAAGKATLCLPYELPVQGFRAYTLADRQESRTAVHFKEVNGTLGAYRPYLLVADGTPQLGGENLQVKADLSSIVLSAGNYYFKGAVHDVVNWWLTSDHAYILQADGLFHKVTSNNPSVTVPAYRAYISYNSHEGAKPLSIVFDGETTGIGGTTDGATDGAADGAVYNLQGQRVADRLDDSVRRQIPAGVYIVNGRKVVVK